MLLASCAACSGSQYASHWDGRRGYDGNGDYGYDLTASRSEARSYRARAARYYPVPGTPDDPWGPYIQQAAARFQVPERWIREVMRQESGGNQNGADGLPITSGAGAMGLMQVMPTTYDMLRRQYGLGDDPYEPHDNIMAGTAYIHDMYAIYGAPGFLAAYNAGPYRLDAYLAGGDPLPTETVNYVAAIAPRLGNSATMTGPLAVYAGSAPASGYASADANRAYAGGGMVVSDTTRPVEVAEAPVDPIDRAFDGGGLVTPDAPTGRFTPLPNTAMTIAAPIGAPVAAPVAAPAPTGSLLGPPRPALTQAVTTVAAPPSASTAAASATAALMPVSAAAASIGGWGIQIGAFPDPAHTQATLAAARVRGGDVLAHAQPTVTPVQRAGTLYRGRFTGMTAQGAAAACDRLSRQGMDCFAVPPGF
jgi:hypothetical protein